MQPSLEAALELRNLLCHQNRRIVFAESCTAGRISATLASVPGISEYLCGGFAVYRNDSKHEWLGVSHDLLEDPDIGPVSATASEQLAGSALSRTPEADVALAITGDVGPGAPEKTEGMVFLHLSSSRPERSESISYKLQCPEPKSKDDLNARIARLEEATTLSLTKAVEFLSRQ